MNKTGFYTLTLLLLSVLPVTAQKSVGLKDVLTEITANNLTLAAAREQLTADRMENIDATKPDNPEIDLGYQWGSPSSVPNRTQITVMQPFSLSALFGMRRQVADAQNNLLDAAFARQCADILIEAGDFYEDACFCILMDSMLTGCLSLAEQVSEQSARQLAAGETDLVRHNQSLMSLSNIRSEMLYNRMALRKAMDELKRLNGGREISGPLRTGELLPLPADFEAWYAASMDHIPSARIATLAEHLSSRQLAESRTDALPGLSVGYVGEMVTENNYHGFQVGVSLPVWSAGSRIRQAKARLESARLQKEETLLEIHQSMRTLYDQAQTHLAVYRSSSGLQNVQHYAELLELAYEKGELSLGEYYVEMAEYYSLMRSVWQSFHSYNKLANRLFLLLDGI